MIVRLRFADHMSTAHKIISFVRCQLWQKLTVSDGERPARVTWETWEGINTLETNNIFYVTL